MDRPIAKIFDDVFAGAGLDALFPRIAALPNEERAILLKALEHVQARNACGGRGQDVKAILDKFGNSR